MPRAYSYLRFSTPEQLKGDSFRRQTEQAQAYAEKHGLELDNSLTFRDLGVSAFRGANVVEGALGRFIEAVDKGKVEAGSCLLVENLDRLSRDKIMPALNRFSALLEKGIIVVTLSDGKAYDADSLNNLPDLMMSLLVMSRAHEESEMKSRRVRDAWQKKREMAAQNGHKLTSRAPAWLRLRDGKFQVIEKRAKLVQRMFRMALDGHGQIYIARQLNEEGVEPFGDGPSEARKADGWHSSYIRKILNNPAVIGHLQPMRRVWKDGSYVRVPDGPVIENYFPHIIDEITYYRIRRLGPRASGTNGKPLNNLLTGIAYCAHCGSTLHYVNKGNGSKGGQYLVCDGARRKKTCNAKAVRYKVVSHAVLNALSDDAMDIRSLFNGNHANKHDELRRKKEGAQGQIEAAEQAIANLLDSLERVPSSAIEKRLAEQEDKLGRLREFLTDVENRLSSMTQEDISEDVLDAIIEVCHILQSGDKKALADVHARMNASLKKLLERVEVGMYGKVAVDIRLKFHDAERPLTIVADPKGEYAPVVFGEAP